MEGNSRVCDYPGHGRSRSGGQHDAVGGDGGGPAVVEGYLHGLVADEACGSLVGRDMLLLLGAIALATGCDRIDSSEHAITNRWPIRPIEARVQAEFLSLIHI